MSEPNKAPINKETCPYSKAQVASLNIDKIFLKIFFEEYLKHYNLTCEAAKKEFSRASEVGHYA